MNNTEYLTSLVNELRKLPNECEWVEFKHNNAQHNEIGQYISALSNGALLSGKDKAYLVFGLEDQTHNIVGTIFSPAKEKIGNEELENWLLRQLEPKINFKFNELPMEGKHVVILEINAASKHPTSFSREEFIRIGSYRKKLKDFPEKFTRVVLYSYRELKKLAKKDRIRACYFHAALKYVERDYMTNTSLRERFGIDTKNGAMASRIIKDALQDGWICTYDESVGAKARKYIPTWARA